MPMPETAILLICRNTKISETIRWNIPLPGNFHLRTCTTFDEAFNEIQKETALVLIHVEDSNDEQEALRLLESVSKTNPRCASVVLSMEHCGKQAVSMLRAGAAEYLVLPQDLSILAYMIDVQAMRTRSKEGQISSKDKGLDPFFYVLAPEMVELMKQVRRVVPQDTTILLTGETGTGKTRLAQLIHELSPRRSEPFLTVDCGALSTSLIESEMFGHVRGAFTGADRDRSGKFMAAGRGTLLLDEINALPLSLQSKLLRAVDDRVFEPVGSNKLAPLQARLIAISNTSLEQEASQGRFRSDLFYRLNVVSFFLPPLRDRRSAIPALVNKFLVEFASRNRPDIQAISPKAMYHLIQYDWPGNIRELRNVVERAVVLSPGPEIQPHDLPEAIRSELSIRRPPEANEGPDGVETNGTRKSLDAVKTAAATALHSPSIPQRKEAAEILRITAALEKHQNNRLRAAEELGISRMGLYKKLHKYGMMHSA